MSRSLCGHRGHLCAVIGDRGEVLKQSFFLQLKAAVGYQTVILSLLTGFSGVAAAGTPTEKPNIKDAGASAGALFRDSAAKVDADSYLGKAASTLRFRQVEVDFDYLKTAQSRPGGKIDFSFFDDATFQGIVHRSKRRTVERFTLSGRVEGEQGGRFVMVRNGDVMVLDMYVPSTGTFEVRPDGQGGHIVRQVDESALLPCGAGDEQSRERIEAGQTIKIQRRPGQAAGEQAAGIPEDADRAEGNLENNDGQTDDGRKFDGREDVELQQEESGGQEGIFVQTTRRSVSNEVPILDVMVVYTSEARQAAGGTEAIEALAELFVATANETYVNSRVSTRARLVYTAEVNYSESGSANTDLPRLTDTDDGFMDEVHALRDQYGADMVSLLVNNFNACGIAWLYYGPRYGFSVVDFGCGGLTFTHELGHNLGCAHDWAHSNPSGRFPYSYGHRFYGQSGNQFRSVMAYYPGERILNFSNPTVIYDGVPTGVPEWENSPANNASTVTDTAPLVSDYRPAVDMTDCNGNFRSDDDDLRDGTSSDCNGNNTPDECDMANGLSLDSNANGVPDECDCDSSACNDDDPCTVDTCDPDTGTCTHASGEVPFGDLSSNGRVDLDDFMCAIDGFSDASVCPQADIAPCGGNGMIDVDDVLSMLSAFSGVSLCPSPCQQ